MATTVCETKICAGESRMLRAKMKSFPNENFQLQAQNYNRTTQYAYDPETERIKVHCFFTKMTGTIPLFIGAVPFFLFRVNAIVLGVTSTREGFLIC